MVNKKLLSIAITAATLGSTSAFATNGMNLEGYGAKAHAMGGAGMAYDTGNSGVMNNPATLAFMKEGESRLGLGIRKLGPDVSMTAMGQTTNSDGTAYYMPSMSYMKKQDGLTYGIAVLAQGGMGTEYGTGSTLFSMGNSLNNTGNTNPANMIAMSGDEIRSEVSVGRMMFPVSKTLDDGKTTIGASLDVVWAGMDLQMDMDGANFGQMMQGNGGSVSGSMATGLQGMMTGGQVTDVNYARFDFSDDSDYTGEAMGMGYGFKIGMTHKVSNKTRFGMTYHTKTQLNDLKTSNATLTMDVVMGGTATAIPVTGDLRVKDFQWPATLAMGIAHTYNDKLLVAADVKHLDWSSVMDSFNMSFTADSTQANPAAAGFAGADLAVSMDQQWEDQTVISLGVQYKATDKLALRVGYNHSDNPVPDAYLNPLFPATVETHYTAGAGYKIDNANKVGFALAYAPDAKDTSAQGIESSHGQTNWSFNYVHNF